MKKDKIAITTMAFALMKDHFNDKMKKHLSSKEADDMSAFIEKNVEVFPVTQVRNYGTIRNKLARSFGSFSPMELISVMDEICEQYDIKELDAIVSQLHGAVPGSGLDEKELTKALGEFKFIVVGKR